MTKHVTLSLFTADASSGVDLDILDHQFPDAPAHVLASNERLELRHVYLVAAAGGDIKLFYGAAGSGSYTTGRAVLRNPDAPVRHELALEYPPYMKVGPSGEVVRIIAPVGNIAIHCAAVLHGND